MHGLMGYSPDNAIVSPEGSGWRAQLAGSAADLQLSENRIDRCLIACQFVPDKLPLVESHLNGIPTFCDKQVSRGYIESANLKARNVVRWAYGYRSTEHIKLKAIQGCTPWMAESRP